MKKIVMNKMAIFVFLMLMLSIVFPSFYITNIAYATDEVVNFDETNVFDDLKSSTVNGNPFDLLDFAFDESKDLRIINFVEYCYSYRKNQQGNYGLYVYLYNPKGIDISENSGQNKIQMGVEWEKDKDGNWIVSRYEKFRLRFCNKSEKANYKGLFYKFKVVDREIDGKTMLDRVNSNERRYDVSGIELLTAGNQNATEYGVGGTYKFTGYVKGYGGSDEDTLTCVVEDLETLKLEIHHTYFRTNVSSKGKDHYNEINTVYFSVPERIFTEYGKLQKIRAEWWEYKTKLAAITSSKDFYEKLKIGTVYDRNLNERNTKIPFDLFIGYKAEQSSGGTHGYNSIEYDWSFNRRTNYEETTGIPPFTTTTSSRSKSQSTMIPFAFYSPSVGVDEIFNFLYSKPIAGNIQSTVVADWIYAYKNDLGHGYIDCNGRQISKDLFEDSVDEGRTKGYNDKTIDLNDTFDLLSYDSNHSWWDKLWDYGFSWPKTDGDYKDIVPIYEVKASDLVGTNSTISKRLFLNENDVKDLQTYFTVESAKGNRVILFRFANTDYFSQAVGRSVYGESGYLDEKNTDTYVAQQTVFLDFDIIELTFNKDGVYRVIPVVSSPTDIINGFTAPSAKTNIWAIIVAVILIIILLVILQATGILPLILKGVGWLICLPFKLIGKGVKAVNQAVQNKQSQKQGSLNYINEDPFKKKHKKE